MPFCLTSEKTLPRQIIAGARARGAESRAMSSVARLFIPSAAVRIPRGRPIRRRRFEAAAYSRTVGCHHPPLRGDACRLSRMPRSFEGPSRPRLAPFSPGRLLSHDGEAAAEDVRSGRGRARGASVSAAAAATLIAPTDTWGMWASILCASSFGLWVGTTSGRGRGRRTSAACRPGAGS